MGAVWKNNNIYYFKQHGGQGVWRYGPNGWVLDAGASAPVSGPGIDPPQGGGGGGLLQPLLTSATNAFGNALERAL